jgi:pimeloyl-ACP methyl ester carboxylesterase
MTVGIIEFGRGGTPLLFLHGIGGNAENFRPQVEAFGARRRTLAWDMPGYGRSPPSLELTFDGLAGTLLRLLDEARIERIHLVGHSLGGFIALEVAARHPDRLASLVLYSTTAAFGRPDGDWQKEFVATRLAPLEAGRSMAEIATALVDGLVSPRATPEARAIAIGSMSRVPAASYRAALYLVMGFDRRDALPSIAMPTLLIAGAEDRTAPAAVMARMAEKIPGAELAVLDGVGHLAHLERPDAFNAALAAFLDRVDRRG